MTGAYMQYFQKSKIFLYPLLDIKKGEDFVPVETYICWDSLYDETNYKYICVYHTKKSKKFKDFEIRHLSPHKLLDFYDQGDDKQIYVFDYSKFKHDFDMFVKGSYSKFSVDTKRKILRYFGKVGRISGYIESYLDPESHHETYADALEVDINLIKGTHELCSPPDLEKETLYKKIPDELALLKNNSISLDQN